MTLSPHFLNKPFAAGALACLLTLTPMAGATDHGSPQASTSEVVGVGTGAIIGGAVGGPVGAIIGAAIGGHYGDTHDQAKTHEALVNVTQSDLQRSKRQLRQARSEQERLDQALLRAQDELAALSDDIDALFVERTLVNGLQFDVHFDTDESALGDSDQHRLVRLSELLKAVPEAEVELHGFADARGAADYNEDLSLDRAHTVADTLAALGVPLEQIHTFAQGESQATYSGEDLESYSHDRRVSIQLQIPVALDAVAHRKAPREKGSDSLKSAAAGQ